MSQRYCEECKTPNEPEYRFCKNCGTPLQEPDILDSPVAEVAQNDDSINEISAQDMAFFVGKNGARIVNKWNVMGFLRRRFSWCWPAFIWSFFFGLAGTGFWFLYRRMYKLGAVVLAASFALSSIGILSHSESITNLVVDSADCIKQSTDWRTGEVNEKELSFRLERVMEGEDAKRLAALSDLSEMFNLVCAVLSGLFALLVYKRFAVSKIKSYGRKLTPLELSLAGGTSGGALTLGIILTMVAELSVLVVVIMGAFTL